VEYAWDMDRPMGQTTGFRLVQKFEIEIKIVHITGARSTVVTMTSKVNGKTGIFTAGRSETPENLVTKIGHDTIVLN